MSNNALDVLRMESNAEIARLHEIIREKDTEIEQGVAALNALRAESLQTSTGLQQTIDEKPVDIDDNQRPARAAASAASLASPTTSPPPPSIPPASELLQQHATESSLAPTTTTPPSSSNNHSNELTSVEDAVDDDAIAEDFVNHTQTSVTSSTNKQEREGKDSGGDGSIKQVPAVEATTVAILAGVPRVLYREKTDIHEIPDREPTREIAVGIAHALNRESVDHDASMALLLEELRAIVAPQAVGAIRLSVGRYLFREFALSPSDLTMTERNFLFN